MPLHTAATRNMVSMARTVRNPKIDTRSARAKLPLRAEPYWTVISEGCALGYRRGAKGGTWVARFRDETGKQHYGALGAADDARDPDGLSVFSFPQAQGKARDWFRIKAAEQAGDFVPLDRPYTVMDAVTDYLADYKRRSGKASDRYRSVARAERTLSVAKTGLACFAVVGLAQVGVDASHRRFDPVFFGIEPCRGHGAVGSP